MLRINSAVPWIAFLSFSSSFVEGQAVEGASGGSVAATIQNSDPAIKYSPSYCPSSEAACFGAWWDITLSDGTTVKTTAGPSALFGSFPTAFTFTFQGTSLELHGYANASGATWNVMLDNESVKFNSSTGQAGASMQPGVRNFDDLDAQKTHTLTVEWFGTRPPSLGNGSNTYIFFDHLVVGSYKATSSVSSSSSSSLSSTGSRNVSSGSIAGVVVGVLLAIAVVNAVAIYLIRRSRRLLRVTSSQQVRIYIESHSERQFDPNAPPSPSASTLKARPHMSLPPAYAYYTDGDHSYLDLESTMHTRTTSDEGQDSLDVAPYSQSGRSFLDPFQERRKSAASALSYPKSAYSRRSDVYSVKMCTFVRPTIVQGSVVVGGSGNSSEYAGSSERRSTKADKKRIKRGLGTRIRKSFYSRKGLIPPVPALPPLSLDVEQPPEPSGSASTSKAIMSRRSCPPPYAIIH